MHTGKAGVGPDPAAGGVKCAARTSKAMAHSTILVCCMLHSSSRKKIGTVVTARKRASAGNKSMSAI
jgi:hypothetical protein